MNSLRDEVDMWVGLAVHKFYAQDGEVFLHDCINEFVDVILVILQTAVLAAAPEKLTIETTEDMTQLEWNYKNGFNSSITQYTKALQQLFESEEPLQ